MGLAIGVALVAFAVFLVFIGRPSKSGEHPRFLQFEASVVLYPPFIMVFFVMGMAQIIMSLWGN